jgi:formate hydrogenlyase subunit 3/multisubunit Na+/H+ antiporter MnhD subunit
MTFAHRLEASALTLLTSVILFSIAKCYHLLSSRGDRRKLVFGQPICWWIALSYIVGAAYGIAASNDRRFLYNTVAGMGAITATIGWFIGFCHGGLRMDRAFPLVNNTVVVASEKSVQSDS